MNSDVSISCTLSSGLDSSVIFHAYKDFFTKKIMPFSLKSDFFEEQESEIILNRSKKYGYENNFVKINSQKLKYQFDHFLDIMDEPFVSDNLFYQSILTKKVKNSGKLSSLKDSKSNNNFEH